MIGRSVAAAALAAALSSVPATSEPNLPMLGKGRVEKVSGIGLTPDVRAQFEQFAASGEMFGAMYVTIDGRSWGWQTGTFSSRDAKRAARLICTTYSDIPCELYAKIGPSDRRADRGIPIWAKGDVEIAIIESPLDSHIAFAANGLGSYGYGYGYDSAADAEERAIMECELASADIRSDDDAYPRLQAVFDVEGIYACTILDSFQR